MTLGHEDLVRRAARLFDSVVVAVADSSAKRPFFTRDERVDMARRVLKDLKNVEVVGFSGLLIKFIRQHKARVVVRGLRAVSDFEHEFQLAGMNRGMYPDVETVFLTPGEQYMFVSATIVREISTMGGDVRKFVPSLVARRLRDKLKQRGGR
jgi:pantetheine-phosphate adenylyltransferase